MSVSTCPGCGRPCDVRILACAGALQPAVADRAQAAQPHWRSGAGLCPRCVHKYADQVTAARSPSSLHTTTDPNTTFPYFHRDEEIVHSQLQRLPGYDTFPGTGVTIAFLDSGYYPHPDFTRSAQWPGSAPTWYKLDQAGLQAALAQVDLRLAQYVDLTDDGEQVGLATPSLWDGAGDSWHGQMTMAVAAGNGLLSDGLYRGYASSATLLPVKIGRGGGRIPEEDILRGLTWLLTDDNWQRYGVRVVNISIGGDFPQDWQFNPVCRAAHALAQRGVFVAAAAGNRGTEELLAPAQTPTVMTVGGVDDHNRCWRPDRAAHVETLALYHHNYATVQWNHAPVRKPEILALARWVPSPILPPSRVFKETYVIDRLRRVLIDAEAELESPTPHSPLPIPHSDDPAPWMPEVWHGLRRRMNAHKWIGPYYQHVDGTSVAVAQVSAVAAQMMQANPALTGVEVRQLLIESALPLPHLLPRQTGAGLLQPALAVAAALRAHGGVLAGYPRSGVALQGSELQKWVDQGKLILVEQEQQAGTRVHGIYFGLYAPQAIHVSLIGSFNNWQPGEWVLQRDANGWWHGVVMLPGGEHCYRFWIEDVDRPQGWWQPDPENPVRAESGYIDAHSVVQM